jgi:hypothetical protein
MLPCSVKPSQMTDDERREDLLRQRQESRVRIEFAKDQARRLGKIASYIAFGTSLLTLLAIILWGVRPHPPRPDPQAMQIAELRDNLSKTMGAVTRLQEVTLMAATNQPNLDSLIIRSQIADLTNRLGHLEAAVMADPAKALGVPLLRQDLENLRSVYLRDSETAVKQIDRIYDQNKWFIGLMGTMALGLISLAVSNFLQTKKKELEVGFEQ